MKVLIVSNNAYLKGNGVCTAVQSLKSRLTEEGVEVRLLTCENPDKEGQQPDYPLKHFVIPIFEPIIRANGFMFSRIDPEMIRKAVEWADVVHLMEGFPLEAATATIAAELGKPCVGTYHTFTENITANIGLGYDTIINKLINRLWSSQVYNKCVSVQCPTQTVKEHLEENGYTSALIVISNGMQHSDLKESPDNYGSPYKVLCTGRLSNEKSQQTLLVAMRHSRHAGEIELHFAGNGPNASKIKKAAHQLVEEHVLTYEPVFGFYTSDELKSLAASSYLYIHCAIVEVEGLSCMEAIEQGAVPVIAKSKLSSTSQFALDERSLFTVRDSKELAEKIDWWIEHQDERKRMGKEYRESIKRYDAGSSTARIISMYEDAIAQTVA